MWSWWHDKAGLLNKQLHIQSWRIKQAGLFFCVLRWTLIFGFSGEKWKQVFVVCYIIAELFLLWVLGYFCAVEAHGSWFSPISVQWVTTQVWIKLSSPHYNYIVINLLIFRAFRGNKDVQEILFIVRNRGRIILVIDNVFHYPSLKQFIKTLAFVLWI